MNKKLHLMLVLILMAGLALPASISYQAAPFDSITFTILHHNDFHGQLQPSGSNPGLARLANTVNDVRAEVGAENVLLVDAGDEMQGSLLSNLWYGAPVIDAYNLIGYDVATVGNHEFDWGQDVLKDRIGEANYPYVAANLVENDTGDCSTAGWTSPDFVEPYTLLTVADPTPVTVGFIGVTSQETPYITIEEATEGLCFKDPATSILHYYDELQAQVDVIVVISHNGFYDGGYGYGFSVYGDQTLAQKLIDAGKPVPLIIGGHSHTNLYPLSDMDPTHTQIAVIGETTVVQAYYSGRVLGRADITINTDGSVDVAWDRLAIATDAPVDADVQALIDEYAYDPEYLALIEEPIGYSQVDLMRNYNGESMMGDFINDAIYEQLNSDAEPLNDVDMVFNNPGGIRIDWCDMEDPDNPGEYIWTSDATLCEAEGLWTHDPLLLTYGQMFQILPFGNATVVGEMTGAQILELLNQSATLFKGAIQPAGIRYSFFRYADALPGPQPYAWGAFDVEVYDAVEDTYLELDLDRLYRVATNEFLAPAGQDGFVPFKYLTNFSYWGDMLNLVNDWVKANYTFDNPYQGPNEDGTLDGRILRDGDDSAGNIVPITILHHNDSHGNLDQGYYVGYTQLVTLIQQERQHNPDRTLLLTAGDNIQGDAMMYYFKSAALGYTADGTELDPALQINPLIAAFNEVGYDAMTLGNHEFNFGKDIFTSSLAQANFPILQANLEDDGSYGIDQVPVLDYVQKQVGPEGIDIAILGIGNHRVPNYELPSNIPGLTFTDPLVKAQELVDGLGPTTDAVIALTHIGFTENPTSVEVDANVDTNMALTVTGLDTIIGGHSHTNPATGFGPFKYLPTIVGNPDNEPVLINHAYRYNNTLGEVVIGMRQISGDRWQVVSSTGRSISVLSGAIEGEIPTPEDETINDLIQPYIDLLANYNDKVIGETTAPIDALQAYTQETTGANLQTDASVWELEDNGITVDFHLSGAMSNRIVAEEATPEDPYTLTVGDMFTLMPYENSLVVMEMNGPQLKTVLERAFRNYYYYKYVPDYGGYSHYTTCMLDINQGGVISYYDILDPSSAPYNANNSYVKSLIFNGHDVDFEDADTYYLVSTVNYLAAGSCNFNDDGVSLWPLDQIANDTQYYVRDAVINYITAMETVSPSIEGRLQFLRKLHLPVVIH
jgi:5'-nucleotidase/UDP-sugar diphosphatase